MRASAETKIIFVPRGTEPALGVRDGQHIVGRERLDALRVAMLVVDRYRSNIALSCSTVSQGRFA